MGVNRTVQGKHPPDDRNARQQPGAGGLKDPAGFATANAMYREQRRQAEGSLGRGTPLPPPEDDAGAAKG